jgi:tetratricopeptide (TPR) repeat protein
VKGDVHFSGCINGDLYSSDHLIIGHSGSVKGDIHSYNLSNSGKVDGDIFTENKTSLLKGGVLTGDISTYQLVVDEGSDFGGRCKMIDAPIGQKGRETKVEKSPKKKSLLTLSLKEESAAESNLIAAAKLHQPMVFSRYPKIASILFMGFLLIGGFVYFKSTQITNTQKLVKVGYELLAKKKYEDAELVFKDVLKSDRESAKAYAGLGQTFLQRKLYQDAINQFKLSLELTPSNVDYKINLAKTYQFMGQLNDAEKYFQLAIDENPKNASSFYHYGLFMEEKGDKQRAIISYRRALKSDKNFYDAYQPLGKLLEETGRLEDAIAEYTLGLMHDKENPELHLALGKLLLDSNDSSKAVSHLNKALSLMPQNFEVRIKFAEIFKKKGMLEQSLALYEVASTMRSNNAEVHSSLGKVYLEKGNSVDAMKAYQNSVKINPENAKNQYQLGRLFRLAKQFENARQALEKALFLRDNHSPTYYELGLVLLAESEVIKAEDLLNKAVINEPDNVVYSLALADAQVKNKKYDIALDRLLALVKIAPNTPDVLFSVCTVYSKKRFFTAAIKFCEKALSNTPKKIGVMNRLAWLYAKKRIKIGRGLELIREVLKAEPGKSKYVDTFAELLYAKGDIEGSIKSMSEIVRINPGNAYYKKQLWKFKNVPPNPLNAVQN